MKTLGFLLIFFSSFLVNAQTQNVSSRNDIPSGWMAIGSSGSGMNMTWTIQNLNSEASGSKVNVVLLHNIPKGWVITGVETTQRGTQFQKTTWTILNANGYINGSKINVVSMENVDESVWKKVGYENNAVNGAKYTLENIGGYNSTTSSGDDGYIADEDRPIFSQYTPNTPAQIAAHKAKVAEAMENAWLAGQTNFYFYNTTPKKCLIFVYQLHPLNQTPFHNDQLGFVIVPPSFINSAMGFNKLVVARSIDKYFLKEPTMSDAQNPTMIGVKLENRYKYRIYVVSIGENLYQTWEVRASRGNSSVFVNADMTNPKLFPPPPRITMKMPEFSSLELTATPLESTISLMNSHLPTILYNHDYPFETEVILRIKFTNIEEYEKPPEVYVLSETYDKAIGQQKINYLLSNGREVSIMGNYFSVICLQENSRVKIAYQIVLKDPR